MMAKFYWVAMILVMVYLEAKIAFHREYQRQRGRNFSQSIRDDMVEIDATICMEGGSEKSFGIITEMLVIL